MQIFLKLVIETDMSRGEVSEEERSGLFIIKKQWMTKYKESLKDKLKSFCS